MSAEEYASVAFTPDFSYGTGGAAAGTTETITQESSGGTWDITEWDRFVWDGSTGSNEHTFSISGSGSNISFIFYSKSAIDKGHTLQGILLHYTVRRLMR